MASDRVLGGTAALHEGRISPGIRAGFTAILGFAGVWHEHKSLVTGSGQGRVTSDGRRKIWNLRPYPCLEPAWRGASLQRPSPPTSATKGAIGNPRQSSLSAKRYYRFTAAWFTSAEAAEFIERAKTIIEDDYGNAPLIVIKEPRICRLAPIYLAAVNRAGYATRVAIPLRHPSEIAASLKQRDGADELTSELIWIRHMLEMEGATRNCRRVWTSYDQLLEDWWTVQATIASALNVTWPNDAEAVAPEINAFLAPTLRHFDISREPTPRELGPIIYSIWQTAQAGLRGDENTLREGFDRIRETIDEMDRLGAPQVAKQRREKIALLRETVAGGFAARDAAETAVTGERLGREAAEARATTLERRVREIEGQAAADAARAATNIQRLEARLAEERQRISDLHASVSWRVTGPLLHYRHVSFEIAPPDTRYFESERRQRSERR